MRGTLSSTSWINSVSASLSARVLSRLFRGKCLAGVKQLHLAGDLQPGGALAELADRRRFQSFFSSLYSKEWVVYAQPPADPRQGLDAVLRYLARYVAGAAISDARLLAHDPTGDGSVTFHARNYRPRRKREQLTLTGIEFTRRFALHILPSGFPRVRYFGLLSHRGGEKLLPRCRELLKSSSPWPADLAPASAASQLAPADVARGLTAEPRAVDPPRCPRCPRCAQPTWFLIEEVARPRLCDVLERSGFAPAASRDDTS